VCFVIKLNYNNDQDTRNKKQKFQITIIKMNNKQNKIFDLEKRTTEYAKRVIHLCKSLYKNIINEVYIKQIIRSSGSIGANYREANDSLGNKDFLHKIKISRKETKETLHWLELIEEANPNLSNRMQDLKKEGIEIKNILSAILLKKK